MSVEPILEQTTFSSLFTTSDIPTEGEPTPGFLGGNPWIVAIGTLVVIVAAVLFVIMIITIRKRSRYDYSALKEHKALPLKIEMMNKLQQDMVRDAALLNCSFYLRSSGQYRLIDHLPTIGWRKEKQWFLVKHNHTGAEKVLSISPKSKHFPLVFNRNSCTTLQSLLQAVKHPYIMPVFEVGFQEDKEQIIVIRDYQPSGSLKDLIYNSRCLNGWHTKYKEQGEPVPVEQIRLYGQQILQALLYLQDSGFPYFMHLNTGNIIFEEGICRLTEFENCLFGLEPKHADNLRPIYKHHLPFFDSVCFGTVVYEMATGTELKGTFPSIEDMAKLQEHSDLKGVIEYIFNAENLPTIQMISKHRFFTLKNSASPAKSKHAHLSSAGKALLKSVRKGKLFRMRSVSKLKPQETTVTVETEMTSRRSSVSSKASSNTTQSTTKPKLLPKPTAESSTDLSQTNSTSSSVQNEDDTKDNLVPNRGLLKIPGEVLSTERSALMLAIRSGAKLKKIDKTVDV